MNEAAGLVLALASAVVLNWGFFAQHGAAHELPPLTLRRPLASLAILFRDLRWLAGFVAGLGGWVLYLAALALAPLSLVQSASAGGIGVLALLVHRRGAGVQRREWWGVGVAFGGLVLLGISLVGGTAHAHAPGATALALWLACSAVVAGAGSTAGPRLAAGAGLGVAAGLMYASGDVATKAITFGGAWLWLIPVMLAAHSLGFVTLQFGFQRGGALATAGVATLVLNSLPIAAGVALYREHLPAGAAGAARVVAFAATVVGASLLMSSASAAGEERDGVRGEALAAAGEAEAVGRGGAHVHLGAS
jgi:hypothetical protein